MLALILIIAGVAPVEEWNCTFEGSGNDTASSVWQAPDGDYIISGRTWEKVREHFE